jgi:hypothetical protein
MSPWRTAAVNCALLLVVALFFNAMRSPDGIIEIGQRTKYFANVTRQAEGLGLT